MDGENAQQPGKTSLFSYAPDLPISIRIVSFLLFLAGAFELVFGLIGFLKPTAMSIAWGVLLLLTSNGLARLKKWALLLYLVAVVVGFVTNPVGGILALVLALFVVSHYKRFA